MALNQVKNHLYYNFGKTSKKGVLKSRKVVEFPC